MSNRIVLNETSYHGKGAIAQIVTEAQARGFAKAFVCTDPDLVKFGVSAKVTDLLEAAKASAYGLGVGREIDPFMTLSFMSLPVIPTLRLTTRGVIDVNTQQYV